MKESDQSFSENSRFGEFSVEKDSQPQKSNCQPEKTIEEPEESEEFKTSILCSRRGVQIDSRGKITLAETDTDTFN